MAKHKLSEYDLSLMRSIFQEAKKSQSGLVKVAAMSIGPQEKTLIKKGLLVCLPGGKDGSRRGPYVWLGLSGFAVQILKRAKRGK